MTGDDDLTMWTIYEAPTDFPEGFITRPWVVRSGGGGPLPGAAHLSRSLEEARGHVPAGLYRMDRQPGDDRTIVETWL